MDINALERRAFLKSAGAAFVSCLSDRALAGFSQGDEVFASAYRDKTGNYGVLFLDELGSIIHRVALPGRGHDVVFHPYRRQCVVFARRPGNFALVLDLDSRREPIVISSPEDRHFYGHGVFSRNGKLLYAAENDFDNRIGVIGIYSVIDGFARIGEFRSHGIGPHEILLDPLRDILIVANGGVETHPDFGRSKLNIPDMVPSIVFLDAGTGNLMEKHQLPGSLNKLSIRHMDVSRRGRVVFGCQYEGPRTEFPPLIGSCQLGEEIRLWNIPTASLQQFANYVGSVALNRAQDIVAVTLPKGNRVAKFSLVDEKLVSDMEIPGSFGISKCANGFQATTVSGSIHRLDWSSPVRIQDIAFDNHVSSFELF